MKDGPMDQRVIDIGPVKLAIAESGAGGRPLLLLHGFTGAKEDFTDWLDRLAGAGWHAVAPDHRGHGESDKPDADDAYSLDILASDGWALADALGWDRCALLGHSMGGYVVQRMAIAAPRRVDALVLMDTGHRAVGIPPEMVEAAVGIVRTGGVDALADIMLGRDSPLDTPAHKEWLAADPGRQAFEQRKFRATSPHLYAALSQQLTSATDTLEGLRTLDPAPPTLVIVGEQDKPFLDGSRAMADAIDGATLSVIADAGHSPQFENPDSWWAAVSGFLASLPQPA
jgi:pimeloyl-ACP methyl ester carboxylesterase